MWHILKAEIVYNKYTLISFYSLFLFLYLAIISGIGVDEDLLWFLFISVLASTTSTSFAKSQKEKRMRFHALLPLSLLQVGFIRLSIPIFVYLSASTLLLLFLFFGYNILHGWVPSTIIAMFVSTILIQTIIHDLGSYGTKKYRSIFILIIFGYLLLGMILAVLAMDFKPDEQGRLFFPNFIILRDIVRSTEMVLFIMIPALVLFYPSIIIFARRKSYLG